MVLGILIVLWAAVLLPPYLQDRQGGPRRFSASSRAAASSAQRFLPLEHTRSNVVQLRPGAEYNVLDGGPSGDESDIHLAWQSDRGGVIGMPGSLHEARERRRQVFVGLTLFALVTLLGAFVAGGWFIPIAVLADISFLGYAFLLVRHRQIAFQQAARLDPIRPAVTPDESPSYVQPAPAYLVRSGNAY